MLAAAAVALTAATGAGDGAYAEAVAIARAGSRPAASAGERRAHERMAATFREAGLSVRVQRFPTPRGRSRNVIGRWNGPGRCLRVLMAHTDSMPAGPGAEDNASGLGVLAALAPRLRGRCDVWLVATGAEERLHTGSPDHLGSLALTRIVPRGRLRYALSLDEVGTSARFVLRSPAAAPRRGVERELMRGNVRWQRDSGTGNSDHREFELAGMPGVKLGVADNPCRHEACDTPDRLRKGAFRAVLRVLPTTLSD